MTDPLGWAVAVEGLAALVLAVLLFGSSQGRPAPILLGGHLMGFAVVLSGLAAPALLGLPLGGPWVLAVWMGRLLLWVSLIGFAAIYPARRVSGWRGWLLVWTAIPAVAIVAGLFAKPDLFLAADLAPRDFLKSVITALRDVGLVLSLVVFGRAFLSSPAGSRRRQYVFILVPFVIYGLNDGVDEVLHAAPARGLFLALSIAGLVLVAALGVASLRRLVMSPPAERAEDRFFLLWLAASVPAAFLQVLSTQLGEADLFLHFLVDGVAVLILFYGVAREQILDLDVKLRWTIGRGTVAAIVLAVFFIVANVGQNFFNEKGGLLLGGIATGVMLLAIHPLQRMAERLAEVAVPRATPVAQMPADDRMSLYRTQVELAWADGVITRKEQDLLRTLRDRLGIPPTDAERIEREVVPAP